MDAIDYARRELARVRHELDRYADGEPVRRVNALKRDHSTCVRVLAQGGVPVAGELAVQPDWDAMRSATITRRREQRAADLAARKAQRKTNRKKGRKRR